MKNSIDNKLRTSSNCSKSDKYLIASELNKKVHGLSTIIVTTF
jgi:hypothetical protein